MARMDRKVLALDVETTGFLPRDRKCEIEEWPHVIELYACVANEADGGIVDELDTLIEPYGLGELPAKITEITGISRDDLRGKPGTAKAIAGLVKLCGMADRVVAHNIDFDVPLLRVEGERVGVDMDDHFPTDMVCTMKGTEHMFGRWPKLHQLYERLHGAEMGKAHRAREDVHATLSCYLKLVDLGEIK